MSKWKKYHSNDYSKIRYISGNYNSRRHFKVQCCICLFIIFFFFEFLTHYAWRQMTSQKSNKYKLSIFFGVKEAYNVNECVSLKGLTVCSSDYCRECVDLSGIFSIAVPRGERTCDIDGDPPEDKKPFWYTYMYLLNYLLSQSPKRVPGEMCPPAVRAVAVSPGKPKVMMDGTNYY